MLNVLRLLERATKGKIHPKLDIGRKLHTSANSFLMDLTTCK